jgi:ubiquinone biosynthesis protein UbiJ
MTEEQLAAMHKLLAKHHRKLANVIRQYHADLAERLADEAALIPRRTAIVERLREREQQIAKDGDLVELKTQVRNKKGS